MVPEHGLQMSPHATEISYKIVLLLFSALFLIFPYWNGLFFHPSFSYAAVYLFVSLIFLSVWWSRKGIKVTGWTIIDYLAVGYVLSYIIAAINPANYELAIIGIFRNISYLGVYLLVRVLQGGRISRLIFLKMFSISGALIGIYGFAAGFGTVQRAGAIQAGRLSSVFEYPNSAAAYLVVIFILTVSLIVIEHNKLQKMIYAATSFIILAFIVYSFSRGAWLILGLMIVFLIVLTPKGKKIFTFFYSLLPLIALLFSSRWLGEAITNKQVSGWAILIIGMIITAILVAIFERIVSRIKIQVNKKFKWLGIILAAVFLCVLILFADRVLPQSILSRFSAISLQEFSALQRFVFFKDALTAYLNNPVLGNGYGTWMSSYQSFQMYPYNSKQAHGYLFDVLLDVGVVGFLFWFAWLIYALRSWWSNYKNTQSNEERLAMSAILVAILALLGHSLIDFDMSYGVMNFLLWALIALSVGPFIVTTPNAITSALNREGAKASRKLWYSVMLVSLIGSVIMAGYAASDQINKAISVGGIDPNIAKEKVDIGIAIAPYRSDLRLQRAKVLDFLYGLNPNDKFKSEEIKKDSQTAAKLAPYDFKIAIQAASYNAKYGDGLRALSLYQEAWKNGKFSMQALELYLKNSDSAGAQFYAKNKQESKRQFQNAWRAYLDTEQKVEGFAALPSTLPLEFPYQITPVMRLNAAESVYYLGNYDEVIRILSPIVNGVEKAPEDSIDKAKLLLSAASLKSGKGVNEQEITVIKKKKHENEQFLQYILGVNPLDS